MAEDPNETPNETPPEPTGTPNPEPTPTPDKGSGVPSDIDRAEKNLEERKKIVEEEKKILDRKEKLQAIQMVGGHTVAGAEDTEPKKEESDHDYRMRIEKEMAAGKTDFKDGD